MHITNNIGPIDKDLIIEIKEPKEEVIDKTKLSSIGKGSRSDFIERELIFDAPKKDVVIEVIDLKKSIEIDSMEALDGRVLVNGYIHCCTVYTTMKRPPAEKSNDNDSNGKHGYGDNNNQSNNNQSENKKKDERYSKPGPHCEAISTDIALDGVVRHTSVWIPFNSYVEVLEAREGDICDMASASIVETNALKVKPVYEEEYDVEQGAISFKLEDKIEKKFIKSIIDKTIIELNVEVLR